MGELVGAIFDAKVDIWIGGDIVNRARAHFQITCRLLPAVDQVMAIGNIFGKCHAFTRV